MSVLRGVWEPSLLPGNHIQCSGKLPISSSLFLTRAACTEPCFNQLCFTCVLFIYSQNMPPDLAICNFILEQSLSVRALQEMLANTVDMSDVRLKNRK